MVRAKLAENGCSLRSGRARLWPASCACVEPGSDDCAGNQRIFLFLTFLNNILSLTLLAVYFRSIARLVAPL